MTLLGRFFSLEDTEITLEIRRDTDDGEILASDTVTLELKPGSEWSETISLTINASVFYDTSVKKYLVVSVDGDYNLQSKTFISFDFTYAKEM